MLKVSIDVVAVDLSRLQAGPPLVPQGRTQQTCTTRETFTLRCVNVYYLSIFRPPLGAGVTRKMPPKPQQR